MLPRLKMMQPRASDMGIMNMGKTYSTAILQHATHLDGMASPKHSRVVKADLEQLLFHGLFQMCQLRHPP